MMNRVGITIVSVCATVLLVPLHPAKAFQDGHDLLEATSPDDTIKGAGVRLALAHYVKGIIDGHRLTSALNEVQPFFCIDAGTKTGDSVDAVGSFVINGSVHGAEELGGPREFLKESAHVIVFMALMNFHRCDVNTVD